MYIVFRAYLARLEAQEKSRPASERRMVPTMEELARMVRVHPVTLSNIANNNIQQLNLQTAGRIMQVMRDRGFPMEITDFLAFRPRES